MKFVLYLWSLNACKLLNINDATGMTDNTESSNNVDMRARFYVTQTLNNNCRILLVELNEPGAVCLQNSLCYVCLS